MAKGVYQRSKEHLEKMKLFGFQKGNVPSAGNRKGCVLTEEHKRKISESQKGKIIPEFVRVKLRKPRRPFSEETRRRMSTAAKNRVARNGPLRYWLGKKNPYLTGENSPLWKGGITPQNVVIRSSPEYRAWRIAVLKRDNFTCQDCGAVNGKWDFNKKKKIVVEADHTKPFSTHSELRFDVNNGRALCKDCHKEKTARDRLSCNTDWQPGASQMTKV